MTRIGAKLTGAALGIPVRKSVLNVSHTSHEKDASIVSSAHQRDVTHKTSKTKYGRVILAKGQARFRHTRRGGGGCLVTRIGAKLTGAALGSPVRKKRVKRVTHVTRERR